MAPDADALRQRRQGSKVDSAEQSTAPERICSLDNLKPSELCIDGIIYDLTNFQHPGGESIGVFGGNDATVQYKMIHPYHTEKHLQKMKRVGKVADYVPEYKFDTPFERELKKEVFKIVNRGKEFGTLGWFFRAFCYIGIFFYLQYLWITQGTSWQLSIIYGVAQALIGMNVQHDANHGASSKNPIINDYLGLGADFIGGSRWLWMEQHWTHHAYTNQPEKDPDGKGAEPLLLFNNYPLDSDKRKYFHNFQAFFYLFVLAGYWISSIFNPEILDLKQRGAQGVGFKMESEYIVNSRKYAIALRVYYIIVHCIIPFRNGFEWGILGNILLMGVAESLALASLFALSHNFEESERDPIKSVKEGGEPVDWFKAQVETSCTYGGFISGCVTGGLNFQVEHHLFPRMSSAWYPYIAPTVREVCKKHGVRYVYYPWVWQNLISTVKYLHAAGTGSYWKNNPLKGEL